MGNLQVHSPPDYPAVEWEELSAEAQSRQKHRAKMLYDAGYSEWMAGQFVVAPSDVIHQWYDEWDRQ